MALLIFVGIVLIILFGGVGLGLWLFAKSWNNAMRMGDDAMEQWDQYQQAKREKIGRY